MWTADAPGADSTGRYALKWPWESGRLRGSLLVPTNAPEATETVITFERQSEIYVKDGIPGFQTEARTHAREGCHRAHQKLV